MSDQTVDMLEAVHRPQIARLQAENARLRECMLDALRALIEDHNRDKAERILAAALAGGRVR